MYSKVKIYQIPIWWPNINFGTFSVRLKTCSCQKIEEKDCLHGLFYVKNH